MTSEQHYTVKVQGITRCTESRNFDAEYDVPYTVKPEDLLEYIKEQVEAEDLRLERDSYSLSPSASFESSFYGIESYDHESYDQIYWEEGDDLMVDGDYLVGEGSDA